ncbi:hypothetical protein CHUAL_001987 [Chamberlinius hualienensis]
MLPDYSRNYEIMNWIQLTLVVCLMALLGPGTNCALAKRFDCEVFCRTTGFHGNVGGCSPSASSLRLPPQYRNSLPNEPLEHYVRI